MGEVLIRSTATPLFLVILWIPAWWLAGRLPSTRHDASFRLMISIGVALVGYLSFVNLVGRATENSLLAVYLYLSLNAVGCVFLSRDRAGLSITGLLSSWRRWRAPLLVAVVLALPQWIIGVSTPYWDEVASGAIHLTAPNQFAEGLFPPRHNAFPSLPIKYHYGFAILVGTLRWLTGLSSNVCIDLVSTALWLFIFLFLFHWFRHLKFSRLIAYSSGFACLLGGSLAWLYVPWLETYRGFAKVGDPSFLAHRSDSSLGWWENLVTHAQTPVFHLRNRDDSLSNLPWDIANQFQQHAVALGIALTVFAAYLFCEWLKRSDRSPWLLLGNTVCFGVLMLGHAVIGGVACLTAGLMLVLTWLCEPSLALFRNGLLFVIGVTVFAFGHGGMLSRGADYGTSLMHLNFRDGLGYSVGGLSGFIHWNIAGFGVLLLMTLWALATWKKEGEHYSPARRTVFAFFAVMLLVSYIPPQILYYSYGRTAIEEFTEIAKFFFVSHLAMAILFTFGIASMLRYVHWLTIVPLAAMMVVGPMVTADAVSFTSDHTWKGFYSSPYLPSRTPDEIAMGKALRGLKESNRDIVFNMSPRSGYLHEALVFGGSLFITAPQRYERTGSFAISRKRIAQQTRFKGRMWRLKPGAAEEAGVSWFYCRPSEDFVTMPLIVRSRFGKLVDEGYFVESARSGLRAIYRIARPMQDLDNGIDRHWKPKVILQARTDWDGDGLDDLIFYDYKNKEIIVAGQRYSLPQASGKDYAPLYVGTFPGDERVDLLVADLGDTFYWRGDRLAELYQSNDYFWSYWDSRKRQWDLEYARWFWPVDIPLIADLDGDGFDSHVAYRWTTGEWLTADGGMLEGPKLEASQLPLPVAGRFQEGSAADLGVWSARTGKWVLQSTQTDKTTTFFHGRRDDIVVPGDYDGDGYDEAVVWRPGDLTWYQRHVRTGEVSSWKFGSPTGIPLPADYNADGRLDPAYWEPAEGRIYVTYTSGRQIDLTLEVPQGTIPAFVNMY